MDTKNIESAIMLSMLGDMIGFGNGITEFNGGVIFNEENFPDDYEKTAADYSETLVFNFIYNGAYTYHPLPHWTVSDDTIMLFANARALIKLKEKDKEESDINLLVEIAKNEYIALISTNQLLEKFREVYHCGLTTLKYITKLRNGDDYKLFTYNEKAGGSGGTMRSAIFGTVFWKKEDILILLESTLKTTYLTHPNAIAFLGAIMVSLFASYAMQKLPINTWPYLALEIVESNIIDNMMEKYDAQTIAMYKRDKKMFCDKWNDYYEDRFISETQTYKRTLAQKYPSERTSFYNLFSSRKKDVYPGAGGDDSTIVAYDCLIESDGSWEKIVTYSMLHVGDSDTTGAICAYLYGLVYGTPAISKIMIDNIKDTEYLEKAKNIIKSLKSIL